MENAAVVFAWHVYYIAVPVERGEVAPVVTWHFNNGLLWSGQGGRREEFRKEGNY